MLTNICRVGVRRTGPDSFQWCPATGQGAVGTNWSRGSSIWTWGRTSSLWGWWSPGPGCPGRLGWVTHRGPFQPWTCCDSVKLQRFRILQVLALAAAIPWHGLGPSWMAPGWKPCQDAFGAEHKAKDAAGFPRCWWDQPRKECDLLPVWHQQDASSPSTALHHSKTESQSPSMAGVGRALCGSPSPTPCWSRVTQSRLHSTASRRVWNISREGDSTASPGSLGQGSVILRGKQFFLKTTVFRAASQPIFKQHLFLFIFLLVLLGAAPLGSPFLAVR